MTLLEQIEQHLKHLPPEKQSQVLDFVTLLHEQAVSEQPAPEHSLSQHPAFGSWRERHIDALDYQRQLRAEDDEVGVD